MVKKMAVGVDPVDTKMTGKLCTAGAVAGMDFSGSVVAAGPKAQAFGAHLYRRQGPRCSPGGAFAHPESRRLYLPSMWEVLPMWS